MPPIRVGLLLDSMNIPSWACKMIEMINSSDYAKIKLVVLNRASAQTKRSKLSRILRNKNLLFSLYYKLDSALFPSSPDAFESKDATNILTDVLVIGITPRQTRHADFFADNDLAEIRKYEIDVFVRLGFRILKGEILNVSKFGVWSLHHGDNEVNRGGPAGVWEILEGHPTTGSILQILSPELDGGMVLCRSYSATDSLSITRNRNNYYWKSLLFIPRKLRELHRLGSAEFFSQATKLNKHPQFYSRRLYTTPRNMELVRHLARHLTRYSVFKLRSLVLARQWILLYDLQPGFSTSLRRFKKIIPPKDRFWADPHIIYRDNAYYIFIEEYTNIGQKGFISVLIMDEEGKYQKPVKVLERPYHLSYPFVFNWQDNYYLIPESANNQIEVYRCVEFPNKWELHSVLMKNVAAADTTLFYYQDKWWMFTNIVEVNGASSWDELFLFYAKDPLSDDWTSHPHNPIVSDVRQARSAGGIIEIDAKMYRPSQDSSRGYGYGLNLNEIVKLNEKEYEERTVTKAEPLWHKGLTGLHTIAHANRLTMIDARLNRPKDIF